MTLAEEPLNLLADYPRPSRWYDEAVDEDGSVRPVAEGAMRALAGHDLEDLAVAVEREGADQGVVFHASDGDEVFVVDPVPRVISASEWARVEAGLAQRVRALNAFVADVYGDRRIVAEGVVPERVIEGAEYFEPAMQGVRPPGDLWIGIAGLDLVRGGDGRFAVLEDNVRTPSGFAYAAAARRALTAHIEVPAGGSPAHARRPVADAAGGVAIRVARARVRARRRAHRRRGQLGLLRARVGGPGARHPARRARRARPRRGRRHLPPHQRRPPRHRRRQAPVRADPRGPRRGGQRVRHRDRRRQAHARLRRGHDSLLRG